mmetsp:Transcript_60004/g.159494  ORF Transcript_60004/g.159494 Transcript_60004/m.159494 type:complete len:137 (-) Transcript_60004:72-482(-)
MTSCFQPRNVIGAHIIASVTAILLDYLSNPFYAGVLPQWIAQALGPSIVVGITTRLGLIHPPAAAVAMVYLSQAMYLDSLSSTSQPNLLLDRAQASVKPLGWLYLACPVLLSTVMLVVMALLINNMRRKIAYPLYW